MLREQCDLFKKQSDLFKETKRTGSKEIYLRKQKEQETKRFI